MNTINLSPATLHTLLKFRSGYSLYDISDYTTSTRFKRSEALIAYSKYVTKFGKKLNLDAPKLTERQAGIGNALLELYNKNEYAFYLCSAGPGTGKTTTIAYGLTNLYGLTQYRVFNYDEIDTDIRAHVPKLDRKIVCIGVTHSTCINLRKAIMASSDGMSCAYVKSASNWPPSHSIAVMTMARFMSLSSVYPSSVDFLGELNMNGVPGTYLDIGLIVIDEYQTMSRDQIRVLFRIASLLKIPIAAFGDPRQNMFDVGRDCGMMAQWNLNEHPRLYRVELLESFRMSPKMTNAVNILSNELYRGLFKDLISMRKIPEVDVEDNFLIYDNFTSSENITDIDELIESIKSIVVEHYENGRNIGLIFDNLGTNDLASYVASKLIESLEGINISRVRDSNFCSVRSVKFVELSNCPGHEFDISILVTSKVLISSRNSVNRYYRNYYYTAISRAREFARAYILGENTIYKKYHSLRNTDVRFYTNNGFVFNPKITVMARARDWLISNSLCEPNNETYSHENAGLIVNGCGVSTIPSCTDSSIPLVYGKNFRCDHMKPTDWICPPSPKILKNRISNVDIDTDIVVGVQRLTEDAICTIEGPIEAIRCAIAYNRRYARVYTDSAILEYDVEDQNIDAFVWFTNQLQCINFGLRDNGVFVDTEFSGPLIDEICVLNYTDRFQSKFIRIGDTTKPSCYCVSVPRIRIDEELFYYGSHRDLEKLDHDPDFATDVQKYISVLRDTGYFVTSSSSMTLSDFYHLLCGISKSSLEHTAAYDCVMLSEIYTKLELRKMINES